MPDSSDYQNRLELFNRLTALPTPQLGSLIFALNPPEGNVPPPSAAPATRIEALLTWVESPIGCRLDTLKAVLNEIDASQQLSPSQYQTPGPQPQAAAEQYQQEVVRIVSEGNGTITETERIFLDVLQEHLSIPAAEAQRIQQRCLSPYASYRNMVERLVEQSYPLTSAAKHTLQRSRRKFSLSDLAANQIEKSVLWGEDDLSSEQGIDYVRLRRLLKACDWKGADQETIDRMLDAMGKRSWYAISDEDLLNFPCADLKTIDRLWVKYSHGRFGFSVQQQIYIECGATFDGKCPDDWQIRRNLLEQFERRVGWRKRGLERGQTYYYYDVTFSTSSPKGHLPALYNSGGGCYDSIQVLEVGLASRLADCS
ncbi:putative GUN4 domain containing protein [Halomicronema hongdechloris C2206]|uniref:GUN4 domain containing protein n=1 Tax=Halomicronema hongdechloris C2206 TaxID=1641165 RepID=A0A1Z3HMF6_9CYAN|nr:GUN4 domain-containing protein [Halomicronema hongdechloris]ASC71455.1 putative GUN4 domain containing protein [Halomicronema hongdechloris C2206]